MSQKDAELIQDIAQKAGLDWHGVFARCLNQYRFGFTPGVRASGCTIAEHISESCMALARHTTAELALELAAIAGEARALCAAIKETPALADVMALAG